VRRLRAGLGAGRLITRGELITLEGDGLSVDVNEAYQEYGGWLRPVAPWTDFPSTSPPRDVGSAGVA